MGVAGVSAGRDQDGLTWKWDPEAFCSHERDHGPVPVLGNEVIYVHAVVEATVDPSRVAASM